MIIVLARVILTINRCVILPSFHLTAIQTSADSLQMRISLACCIWDSGHKFH